VNAASGAWGLIPCAGGLHFTRFTVHEAAETTASIFFPGFLLIFSILLIQIMKLLSILDCKKPVFMVY